MRAIKVFLIFFLLSMGVNGQSLRHFHVETAYSTQVVQDQGHSPLPYHGNGLFLGISNFKLKNKFRFSGSIGYGRNKISSGAGQGTNYELNTAHRTNVLAHCGLLKKSSMEKLSFFWGAQIHGSLDYIVYNQKANNLIGYELSISIDPAIYAQYALNKKIQLSFQGHVPILAYTIRPEALGLFPMKDFDLDLREVLTGGSIVSIDKYFNLNTRSAIHFPIKNVALVFFYEYSGGINTSRERKAFSTSKFGLQIPLVFKIKKQ